MEKVGSIIIACSICVFVSLLIFCNGAYQVQLKEEAKGNQIPR